MFNGKKPMHPLAFAACALIGWTAGILTEKGTQQPTFDVWFAEHKTECQRCDNPDAALCGTAFFELQEYLRKTKGVPREDIADALHFERITPEYGVRHIPVDPNGVQVLEDGATLMPPPDPYFQSKVRRVYRIEDEDVRAIVRAIERCHGSFIVGIEKGCQVEVAILLDELFGDPELLYSSTWISVVPGRMPHERDVVCLLSLESVRYVEANEGRSASEEAPDEQPADDNYKTDLIPSA